MTNSTETTSLSDSCALITLDELDRRLEGLHKTALSKNFIIHKYHWTFHGTGIYDQYLQINETIQVLGKQIGEDANTAFHRRVWEVETRSDRMRSQIVSLAIQAGILPKIRQSVDIDRLSDMSDQFFDQLAVSNKEKTDDSPVYLFIKSRESFPFSTLINTQNQILQLSKTHRIILKECSSEKQLQEIVSGIDQKKAEKIEGIFWEGHGKSTEHVGRIQLDQSSFYELTETETKPKLFDRLAPEAPIYLICCETGKGFAKWLAKQEERSVQASPIPIHPNRWWFDPKVGLNARTVPFAEPFYTYEPNGLSQPHTTESDKKSLERHFSRYIIEQNQSFLDSHTSIEKKIKIARKCGHIFFRGFPIPQSLTDATFWFNRAVELGDVESLSMLGRICIAEGNLTEAINYFKIGAKDPQHTKTAELELQALGDCERSQVAALIELATVHFNALGQKPVDSATHYRHLQMMAYYLKRAYTIDKGIKVKKKIIWLPEITLREFFLDEWEAPGAQMKLAKYEFELQTAKKNWEHQQDMKTRLKYEKILRELSAVHTDLAKQETDPKQAEIHLKIAAKYLSYTS